MLLIYHHPRNTRPKLLILPRLLHLLVQPLAMSPHNEVLLVQCDPVPCDFLKLGREFSIGPDELAALDWVIGGVGYVAAGFGEGSLMSGNHAVLSARLKHDAIPLIYSWLYL